MDTFPNPCAAAISLLRTLAQKANTRARLPHTRQGAHSNAPYDNAPASPTHPSPTQNLTTTPLQSDAHTEGSYADDELGLSPELSRMLWVLQQQWTTSVEFQIVLECIRMLLLRGGNAAMEPQEAAQCVELGLVEALANFIGERTMQGLHVAEHSLRQCRSRCMELPSAQHAAG